jgi:hypothetical protein
MGRRSGEEVAVELELQVDVSGGVGTGIAELALCVALELGLPRRA